MRRPRNLTRPEVAKWMLANKTTRSGACLLFDGDTNCYGYPRTLIAGRPVYVHRLVCETYHGDERDRLAIHSCGIRNCINPDHLRWGSSADNYSDAVGHGTRRQRELTKTQVQLARALYDRGKNTVRELARAAGVRDVVIWNAVMRRSYKWVPET